MATAHREYEQSYERALLPHVRDLAAYRAFRGELQTLKSLSGIEKYISTLATAAIRGNHVSILEWLLSSVANFQLYTTHVDTSSYTATDGIRRIIHSMKITSTVDTLCAEAAMIGSLDCFAYLFEYHVSVYEYCVRYAKQHHADMTSDAKIFCLSLTFPPNFRPTLSLSDVHLLRAQGGGHKSSENIATLAHGFDNINLYANRVAKYQVITNERPANIGRKRRN